MAEDYPLTDREAIIDELQDLRFGDEITIEDTTGYKDNREITVMGETFITFGEPGSPVCRLINIHRGTAHKMPKTNPSVPPGNSITKLWVW